MDKPVDETRDANPIGDEEPARNERAEEDNVREGEPALAAALEADDEYEMVDPAELVDVAKEKALEAEDALTTRPADVAPIDVAESSAPDVETREPEARPLVKVAKALSTTSVSIPPPPRNYSRTMPPPPPPRSQAFEKGHVPPPPPFRRTSTSLPPPPRTTISSAPPLTMSETVPPIPSPSENRSGRRERSWPTKRAAAAAAIAAALATAFFGTKRGNVPTSAPPKEVAAAIVAPEPEAHPEVVTSDPVATSAAVPAPETPEPTPSPSPAATAHPSKVVKDSPPAENHKEAAPSASDRAELAAIALQVGAQKAAACTMNFNTIPPSRVALDGRDLGMTPKLGVSVPPGTHVVTFANAGGKKVTSAPCKPGEQKTVSMRLPI